MAEGTTADLRKVIHTRNALVKYRDETYIGMMKTLNEQSREILRGDLGSQFVQSCGRDLAGELVRNCFDTSDYNITVDQMAMRILKFTYEDEYDPLRDKSEIHKDVYNYVDLQSSSLDRIVSAIDSSQKKLFIKEDGFYVDKKLIESGKKEFIGEQTANGKPLEDSYSGAEGEYITDKNGRARRRLQVEHSQALAAATYNERYIKEEGAEKLKKVYNTDANFSMMLDTANQVKSDVRIVETDGKVVYMSSQKYNDAKAKNQDVNDITHRATPAQYAEAVASQWENANPKVKEKLIEAGYLDENGKTPEYIKNKMRDHIQRSQNAESIVILKNTQYGTVGVDAFLETKASVGKIIAGQIIYYVAPPIIYEVRKLLKKRSISLDDTLKGLAQAGGRIFKYTFDHLKDMFQNVLVSSLKKFIKTFMDILINLIKATVKKIVKLAKNLVLATVDAARIIAQKGSSRAAKADAVCTLFGVTITTVAVDVLFEMLAKGLHIPDFLLMPLQIITTIVCTNLTMLILQKADLFDVRHEFKLRSIEKLFSESRDAFSANMVAAAENASHATEALMKQAENDCRQVYTELVQNNPFEREVRDHLRKISTMFGMNVDFDKEWLRFIGLDLFHISRV